MPAEWVSGDIYDAVRLDEENVGFYIADAVGHSMPAALLTIFLKQAIVMRETDGSSYRIFSPSEVIDRLNKKMSQQKLSGCQFATGCYCILNTATMEMTFARAGHPYPVLLRKGDDPVQLHCRGSLLGIFENSEYEQETIKLQAGDKLILYSDGTEPFLGQVDEESGFEFSQEFYEIMDLPITEMFEQFRQIVGTKQINPAEFDDVTLLGFEVL